MGRIIEMKNVGKKYRKQEVLKGIDISFEKGEIYGVIGPNGAGKSTIFKIMSGLVKQTEGELIFFQGNQNEKNARKKIGFMIENPYLELGMSAYQNMMILSILYDVSKEKVNELLELVGLGDAGKKKVRHFSLGMKQRLGIAMALLKDPEMIVLDEPMNGLDPKGIVDIRNLLFNLCREKEITVVISSHNLHELEMIADIFYLIHNGRVIDVKTKSEIDKIGNHLEEYYMEMTENI